MESGDLRIFRAVAEEGSVTKAAAKLGYVQSNVTGRLRLLETELGTRLFHRHSRGMTLSASGHSLLSYAERVLGLLDEAAQAVTSDTEPRGPLTIGSTQTCAAVRLPTLMADYHHRYPDVTLALSTGHSANVLDKVLRYEADGAFISGPCPEEELHVYPAFDEELVLVSESSIESLEEAVHKPILVFTDGCYYRAMLERWLQEHARKRAQIMEFGILEAILGGIAAGLGVSLLPRSVASSLAESGAVRLHPMPAPYNAISTNFVIRRDAYVSKPLQLFLESLNQLREDSLQAAQQPESDQLKPPLKQETAQRISQQHSAVPLPGVSL